MEQPINKQDVLIRLLKDGHISDEEFKALWESMPKPIAIRDTTDYIQTGRIKSFDEDGYPNFFEPDFDDYDPRCHERKKAIRK